MVLFTLALLGLLSSAALAQQIDNTRFNIQVQFITPPPTDAKASFDAAVKRWQEVITGDIGSTVTIRAGQSVCGQPPAAANILVDDLLIFANIEPIDGVGKVLGSAGPCGFDNAGKVRLGSMRFDIADVNTLIAKGTFTSTVLHEMGHIIGVGADWARRGLVSPTAQGTPFTYLGAQGAVGQQEIGGAGKPIVEDVGGAGTARVHWKESVYQNELMTGFLSGATQPMSRLTVRSLIDLGYKVDLTKADDFNLNGAKPTNAPVQGVTKSPTVKTSSPTLADANKGFNIQLIFTTDVSDAQRLAFTNAANRWQKVITNDIGNTVNLAAGTSICGQTLAQPLSIDDIVIFAGVSAIDGVGKILGQAGPCGFDNAGRIRAGNMQFDIADVQALQQKNTLTATILHEMGHVLGIGTAWEGRNLVSNGNPPFTYEGAGGAQGQKEIGGSGKPIVEDIGGAGTARGHWKESVYQDELMTGFLSGATQPLSLLTLESLKDIGYTVDPTQADDFTIPSAVGRRLRELKSKEDMARMNKELDGENRNLDDATEWEVGYPNDKITWDLPTQDKELTEDGEVKTDWEIGFNGEVVHFEAEPKASNVPIIAGAVVGVLAAVGAASAFVVIRRRKGSSAALPVGTLASKQMTAANPMFGSNNFGGLPQQHFQYQQDSKQMTAANPMFGSNNFGGLPQQHYQHHQQPTFPYA